MVETVKLNSKLGELFIEHKMKPAACLMSVHFWKKYVSENYGVGLVPRESSLISEYVNGIPIYVVPIDSEFLFLMPANTVGGQIL
jgi:hypothetical protein